MKYLSFIISLMILMSCVSAQSSPNPIAIKVNSGHEYALTISNLNTGESITGITENGEFLYDWQKSYSLDDIFEVDIGRIKVTHIYKGTSLKPVPLEIFIFDFDECPDPVITECSSCDCATCSSGSCSPCPECSDCHWSEDTCKSNYPNIIKTVYSCDNNDLIDEYIGNHPDVCDGLVAPEIKYIEKDCPEEPECPEDESLFNMILTAVLGLAAGAGIGFTVYRDKDGKLKFNMRTHRHEHRNYYHSIYTVHRAPATHAYGELKPKYVNGVYVPIIEVN